MGSSKKQAFFCCPIAYKIEHVRHQIWIPYSRLLGCHCKSGIRAQAWIRINFKNVNPSPTIDPHINPSIIPTVLVSDHTQWSTRQVVEAYRSLCGVEDAFKNMKNTDFLRWQPAHHWTNQKLRVHALYCVLALLVASLARKIAFESGVNLTLPVLLKELSTIREVAVIYPPGTFAHPKDHITLSRMSARQKKLAQALEIGETLGQIG